MMFCSVLKVALRAASLCLAVVPLTAQAQVLNDVSEVIEARILPGWREADGSHIAGIAVTLRTGWHTYWRSAGSMGISPNFDWQGSQNLGAVVPTWPTPSVFREPGGLSVGYDGDFILPLVIRPRDPAEPVVLQGRYDLGVCADICVPARLSLSATLPAEGSMDTGIQEALRDQPVRQGRNVRCDFAPTEQGLSLTARVDLPQIGPREAVVFEMPGTEAWISDADVRREGSALIAAASIYDAPAVVDRSTMRITVLAPGRGVEITGCTGR